jgi:hypothetical protein
LNKGVRIVPGPLGKLLSAFYILPVVVAEIGIQFVGASDEGVGIAVHQVSLLVD